MPHLKTAHCRIWLFFDQAGAAARYRVRRSRAGLCLGRPARLARRVRAVPAKTTLIIYAADLSSRPAVAGIWLSRSRLSQFPGWPPPGRLPASLTRSACADPGSRHPLARIWRLRGRSLPDKCAAPGQVVLRRCISRVVVQVVPWSVDSWAVSFHWSLMMLAR
jgi:hypothetical protein